MIKNKFASLVAALLPGSTITISDEEAYKESMELKKGVKPLDFAVERTAQITEAEGLVVWNVAYLEGDYLFVEKTVDQKADYYLFKNVGLPPVNRATAIEQQMHWLFIPPQSDNFKFNDLKYATSVYETKNNVDIEYRVKAQGELSGRVKENPQRNGLDNMIASVVEYHSQVGEQALLLEIGEITSDKGGLIQLFNGRFVNPDDVTILNR